jgi:uncharacterized protein
MLKNSTKKSVIAKNYKTCQSIWSKARGLMFTIKFKQPLIMVFEEPQIVSLHMFFVFYPIDVLFLDNKKKVVEIKLNFRPYSFYTPNKKAKYVIELGSGMANNCAIGDKIEF